MKRKDIDKLESELILAFRNQRSPELGAQFAAAVMESVSAQSVDESVYFGQALWKFASAGSIVAAAVFTYALISAPSNDLALEALLTIETHGTVQMELSL
ncbi:MAG: hypothetical protein U0136_00370 [Bdellovibrionota bacterium]